MGGAGSLARELPPEGSRGQGSWHWVQREIVETRKRGLVDLVGNTQMGAEMPECPGRQAGPQGPPKQDISHLQPQGRPFHCLHTCQAATASLGPQEDGNFGAVQASVGKYADLLWEGREKRARM